MPKSGSSRRQGGSRYPGREQHFRPMPKEKEKPRAAEVRAMKLEAAWRSHVGKLTLAQMSSPQACVEHLQKYGKEQGWEPMLEGDVSNVISTYLQSRIAPRADAMMTRTRPSTATAKPRGSLPSLLAHARNAKRQINSLPHALCSRHDGAELCQGARRGGAARSDAHRRRARRRAHLSLIHI